MAFRRRSGFRKRTASRRFTRKTNRVARRSFGRPRYNKYKRSRVRIPNRIMPDYTLVKMKDSVTYITGLGTVPAAVGDVSTINFTISANDLYEAFDLLGTPYDESQPTGFDQWMTFYNSFIVHKSSIRVTPIFWNQVGQDTAAVLPFQITITPVTVASLTSASIDFDEQPYAKYRVFNAPLYQRSATDPVIADTGSQSPPSVFNSMMTKKMLGMKDLSDYSGVRGSDTASPGDQYYWNIEIKSLIPAAAASAVAYTLSSMGLKIDLYSKVQLLDRNTIPESDE